MKIAIVRQRYNPYGGAERFVELMHEGSVEFAGLGLLFQVPVLDVAHQVRGRELFA